MADYNHTLSACSRILVVKVVVEEVQEHYCKKIDIHKLDVLNGHLVVVVEDKGMHLVMVDKLELKMRMQDCYKREEKGHMQDCCKLEEKEVREMVQLVEGISENNKVEI